MWYPYKRLYYFTLLEEWLQNTKALTDDNYLKVNHNEMKLLQSPQNIII